MRNTHTQNAKLNKQINKINHFKIYPKSTQILFKYTCLSPKIEHEFL